MENARGIRIYQKRSQPAGKTQDFFIAFKMVGWMGYGPCTLYGIKVGES